MNKILAVTSFLLIGLFAQAQIPTSGNIFIGYSYSGGNVFAPAHPGTASHSAGLNGWEGSLEGKMAKWVGIVADLSGHYGSHDLLLCSVTFPPPCSSVKFNAHTYTFMFGPRVSIPIGKFTPYAHALLGAGHTTSNGGNISASDTSLAYAIGGGLDYRLIKGVAWRLQGDEVHTRFFGGTQDHFRFSTGVDFRF